MEPVIESDIDPYIMMPGGKAVWEGAYIVRPANDWNLQSFTKIGGSF